MTVDSLTLASWAADGKSIYCSSTADGRDLAGLAQIDVASGKLTYLETPEHEVEAVEASPKGRWLAYRLNIQVPNGILQHHDWSGKNCPHILRKGSNKGWKGFIKEVQDIYDQLEPVEAALIAHNEKGHHAVKKPA